MAAVRIIENTSLGSTKPLHHHLAAYLLLSKEHTTQNWQIFPFLLPEATFDKLNF
jgi:hypothetical protein